MKRSIPELKSKSDSSTRVFDRPTHIYCDGGGADSRLRRQKRKDLIGGFMHRGTLLQQRLDALHTFHHRPRLERVRQKFPDSRPHSLAKHRVIHMALESDDLPLAAVRFQHLHRFQSLFQ
jgi:hypothetical protein